MSDLEAILQRFTHREGVVVREVEAEFIEEVWNEAQAAERARVRQELEAFAQEVGWDKATFRPYLDRICPEEPT